MLTQAEKLFRAECQFIAGVDREEAMPPSFDLPEIAFAGRSNAGKSSLINALTGRKNLARSSNTPGRTQQINFFDIGGRLVLVDLPGYGYASATRAKKHAWNTLVSSYMRGRQDLVRICVLIDSRHGILEADEKALKIIGGAGVVYDVVLTKCDKVKPAALAEMTARVKKDLEKYIGVLGIYPVSSVTGEGISSLRTALASIEHC